MKKGYCTTTQVAKLFGVTPQWINRLVRNGRLKSVRVSERGWHRIPHDAIESYAKEIGFPLDWSELNGAVR